MEDISEELSKAVAKYYQTESDLSASQSQVRILTYEIERFRSQKRELELLNDDWERSKRYLSHRVLEFSNQALEEKLSHAQEYMIMYKEELDEVNSQSEVEIQRLREEIKALKEDLERVQTRRSIQNDEQMEVLEETIKEAIEEKVKQRTELETQASRRPSIQTFDFLPEPSPLPDSPEDHEINTGSQTIRVLTRVRPPLHSEPIDTCLVVTQ